MSVSKKSQKLVKRPRIDWYEVLSDIGDMRQSEDFYRLLSKHPKMSFNRIAYNVLRKYYSTTALARKRWLGEDL